MPNSPTQRFEHCYMPPKKFAWRYDNIKNHTTTLDHQEPLPVTRVPQIMGFIHENRLSLSPPIQQSSAMEPVSPVRQLLPEDTPLDFSIKHDSREPSQKRVRSSNEAASNGPHTMFLNYSDCLKRLQSRSSTAFPGLPNGRSPSPTINGHAMQFGGEQRKRHDSPPRNRKQNAMDTECSEKTEEHLNGSGEIDVNGPGHLSERPVYSRESSPAKENSILQNMLTTPQIRAVNDVTSKIKEIHINTSESFQRSNMGDMGYPVMTSPNQSIAPALLSPVNNIMSLPVPPFFGGMGYMGPAVSPLHGGLLGQGPDGSMIHALAARRQKKKKGGERPFKSYPFDVLQEKLQTANTLAFSLDFSKQLMARSLMVPRSPSSDDPNEPGPSGLVANGKNYPNADGSSAPIENANNKSNESPDYVNGAINHNNACPTNGIDNHTNHVSGDSNDTLPSASPEGVEGPNGYCRKRKATSDAEKTPTYWDKRHKNNLAAKRSREARRRKEDAIANMAVMFEAQCVELKNQLLATNYSYNDLSIQFNRLRQEHEALKIQNNVLQERLSQKRCGQCGAKLPNIN